MASHAYNEIVERLPKLKPEELLALLGDLQALLRTEPKRLLRDFKSDRPATQPATGWLEDLRREWEQ